MSQPQSSPSSVSDSTRFSTRLPAPLAGLALGLLIGLSFSVPAVAVEKQRKLPEFQKIERVVIKTLTDEGITPIDLISRPNVEAVIEQLAKRGWKVPDAKAIIESALPADDYLVRRMAQPDALDFKKHVADMPGGYDRLDRLCRMWHGENTINALVRGPDGYKMIQYMTTTQGGANLGNQLSDAPNGQDFNQMTGRIYTGGELIGRIHVSYVKELKQTQR